METSFVRRFLSWVHERFPLANGLLYLPLYLAALLLGRRGGALEPFDAFGFAAAWSFFLMLRVFDEHKDFDSDRALYPQRVLQRGLVTLRHLKIVGVAAI